MSAAFDAIRVELKGLDNDLAGAENARVTANAEVKAALVKRTAIDEEINGYRVRMKQLETALDALGEVDE